MLDDLNGAFLRAFVLTLLCSSFQGNCYRVEAGAEEEACHVMGCATHESTTSFDARSPFLESPGNLSGPISVFGDKCFLTEVNFC